MDSILEQATAFAYRMLETGRQDVYDLIVDSLLRPLQQGTMDEDYARTELRKIYAKYTRSNYSLTPTVEQEDSSTLQTYKREQEGRGRPDAVLEAYKEEQRRLN